ncbi:MAG: HD domain-containing protein [Planctomycetes bacterium]|nr:HD domain-containing protein [Planctomycetota bacterium]
MVAGDTASIIRVPAVRRRRPGRKAVLLAGVDIGSTAVRMRLAEFAPDASLKLLEELSHPIATGADTFRHGYILPDTLNSICVLLTNYRRLLDDYRVEHRRAVASSSIRDAANCEILIDRIRHYCGLELEILDAVEESRLAYQALLPWLRQHQGSYSLALNIGGGSTELMILRGEDLQLGGSKRLGTSRLFHTVARGGNQLRAEILKSMTANIVNTTRDVYQEYSIARFFLINRFLYRAFRDVPEAERHENDFVIPAEPLRGHLRQAYWQSPLELGRVFNVGLAEVELLIPAMLILDNFIEVSEAHDITFTNTEMLTGLLSEMTMTILGENPLMSFRRQMVRSARAVGERYFYNRSHARAVTEFSLGLFDALRNLLDLDDKDRLLLELTAVLHDIGKYVSDHQHHRHGSYLIKWSDIVGLNERDRILVSQIAFFHRKETPSEEHPEYLALAPGDRIRVSKLAGILRLADVLDRGHQQDVKGLRVDLAPDKLLLHLQIEVDLGLILNTLPKKANLLEQVIGLPIVLRREMPKIHPKNAL